MSSTVANMPLPNSSGNTEHRRNPSEAGSRGFTAVNITPPHSRESSAESPELSPRQTSAGAARNGTPPNNQYSTNGHDHNDFKRKRSSSPDPALRSPRRYDYQPPRKADVPRHMADRALHVLDSANKSGPHPHPPPHHSYYSTTPAGQEHPGYHYDRFYANTNGNHSAMPEDRSNDGSRKDAHDPPYASPTTAADQEKSEDSNDRSTTPQNGQKRKRNFSNRTKTGCLTCRVRKKKCDEARPICNNCERGGFPCQGYHNTRPGSWPKQPPQKQPVPLQSKETGDPNQQHHDTESPVSGNPTALETSPTRPAGAVDGHEQPRPPYGPQSSTPADSRPPYPQQQYPSQWPQHAQYQQSAPPPQTQHKISPQSAYPTDHLPPLSELPRSDQSNVQSPPQVVPPRQDFPAASHADMSRPSTQQNNLGGLPPSSLSAPSQWPQHQPMPQYQSHPQQQEYGSRPNQYPPRIDTSQAQHQQTSALANTANTANTASASYSSYEQKASSKLFTEKDVERSRMLRGALYNYFDATLKNERQRCATALARYNRACEWGSGVSETELQAMLAKVFDPQLDYTHSFLAVCREKGCIGSGVKIEQGFRCTYGYNLRIYDNVFIGENTRIDDSAKVEIGPRTWIGPDVKILTNDVAKDMTQRKGTDGQQCITQGVIIGPEVVIGTGAIIFPGAKLAKGSTVEPYAVVKGDLGEYITQKVAVGAQMGGTIIN